MTTQIFEFMILKSKLCGSAHQTKSQYKFIGLDLSYGISHLVMLNLHFVLRMELYIFNIQIYDFINKVS